METDTTNTAATNNKKSKKIGGKKILGFGLIVLLLIAIGTSVYFYRQYQYVKNNPTAAVNEKNSQETEKVLTAVKSIILIENTEAPTIARVEDPSALKTTNEVFYKNVQKGDYLILYKDRAIIYRESSNQIINVAPIINTAELEKKQAEQTTSSTKKTR